MPPIFIPPFIRRTNKCQRCGQLYPRAQEQCPHCSDLNDQALLSLLEKLEREAQGHRRLGYMFLIGAVVAAVFVTLFAL